MHFLRVNMNDLTTHTQEVPRKYRLLLNRGLIAYLTYHEIDPKCDALDPRNRPIVSHQQRNLDPNCSKE